MFARYLRDQSAWRSIACICGVFAASASVFATEPLRTAQTIQGNEFLAPPSVWNPETSPQTVVATTPPTVDICVIRGLPDKGKGTLWSQWGNGCLASNGKYYGSIGDHLGRDATGYLYEYDPATKTLKQVVDVAAAIQQQPGQYGHGKIHSGIHESADGGLYFSTYWGKHREVEAAFGPDYQGSIVLRYDLKTGAVTNLGAIVPKQGLPTSIFDPASERLYFYAEYENNLAVYNVKSKTLEFLGGKELIQGNRAFLIDNRSRVYMSGKDGNLVAYDPAQKAIVPTKATLPAGTNKEGQPAPGVLRAGLERPLSSGLTYGITFPGQLFSFDPATETVKPLGPNLAGGLYTACIVASPCEKYLYYVPSSHGGGSKYGSPVVQYTIATGQRKILAFLHEPLREQAKYQVGGTYNVQLDRAGERLYITFNGSEIETTKRQTDFGLPSVVVVTIPAVERS